MSEVWLEPETYAELLCNLNAHIEGVKFIVKKISFEMSGPIAESHAVVMNVDEQPLFLILGRQHHGGCRFDDLSASWEAYTSRGKNQEPKQAQPRHTDD